MTNPEMLPTTNRYPWNFHPVVQTWFDENYAAATDCQQQAWPAIQNQQHVLVSAPTGSGKTLAAFLASIDELVQEGLKNNGLPVETAIVYVSPLKALSYDIEKNLKSPLRGIRQKLHDAGAPDFEIRTAVRTGDTSQSERQKMVRKPPHILVTTPESFYLLLTSDSGRNMLRTVRRVIVDEIHALAGNKRGAHFSLSMRRLEMLVDQSPIKVGLSATQKPLSKITAFLTGSTSNSCVVVDSGHIREWDLSITVPSTPLEAVMSTESWMDIYRQISVLINEHQTTLIFVNTRRHVERATRYLAELVGDEHVASHHGSLSKEHRHEVEQRLKNGQLRALVATASLELGIDIGDVDLVCQLCSPRSIAVFLQRVGRSGHSVGKIPKGRIFPTTRDELVESVALLNSISKGDLESIEICSGSLDVLAQQIVAEASARNCQIDDLFENFCKAYPYRNLQESQYHAILKMLAEGFTLKRGRRGAYIHLDAVNRVIRARKGARLVAFTNAGAIPDLFDYDVILEPDEIRIGSVNEDFAFESLAGDIFQLGNASYRILRVEKGYVRVADAEGQPPNIPFWLGEGRGRSDVLCDSVSQLRQDVEYLLDNFDKEAAVQSFRDSYNINIDIAQQVIEYLAIAKRALGTLPSAKCIVFERFFDETGDTHLVVHSVFGSRLNRAWGLALRKRFCVRFNFELQAAALEDNLVLSLGPTHSFALEEVKDYLKSSTVKSVLKQATLGAPMFATRWRWVANTALAVLRNRVGKKVPPAFQRNDSEDLLSLVFPDQVACQENVTGPIEIPDHPLVKQTMFDCLHEVMDASALENLLRRIETEQVSIVCRDLPEPSPLAHEVITARPYAFLDDAPAEERRTLAIQSRRLADQSNSSHLGRLDLNVIEELRQREWPSPTIADELHDALVTMAFISTSEVNSLDQTAWDQYFSELVNARRATTFKTPNGMKLWVAAERLQQLVKLHPDASLKPEITPASLGSQHNESLEQALVAVLRSRLEVIGPATASQLAESVDLSIDRVNIALLALEAEGSVMRGQFTHSGSDVEWCDRRFLARIHKRTITSLRQQIKPVDSEEYVRYLMRWSRVHSENIGEGPEALDAVLGQFEGYEAPAYTWESELLPARVFGYSPEVLDYLAASGKLVWTRLTIPEQLSRKDGGRGGKPAYRSSIKSIPLSFLRRNQIHIWKSLTKLKDDSDFEPTSKASLIEQAIRSYGPLFFDEIVEEIDLLPTHAEEGLVELFSYGIITCDHFGGIRALLLPERIRRKRARFNRAFSHAVQASGRWSLVSRSDRKLSADNLQQNAVEYAAQVLLRRYGVVFRALLNNEPAYFPPWTALRRVYIRMEDRGELRGGRFVNKVVGEQFALPEAVERLRSVKRAQYSSKAVTIHSADPVNLSRVFPLVGSDKVKAAKYLVYRNGKLLTEAKEKTSIRPIYER